MRNNGREKGCFQSEWVCVHVGGNRINPIVLWKTNGSELHALHIEKEEKRRVWS